ncbi:MAG: aromatic amino acid transport family protein [Chlamydiales bacterium]
MLSKKGSILGASLLVAGTCIGGGMLALPIVTGPYGFLPSFFLLLISWAFMTTTALLLAEANLWMEEGVHIITLASRLLGPVGKAIAWLLYLFIGYASLVAYAAGGGGLITSATERFFGIAISPSWAIVSFVLVLGAVIYFGNMIVGRVNTILMLGLIGAYILLIGRGVDYIKWHYLARSLWKNHLVALPMLLTVFSFQTIVPSLTLYLKQDGKALRMSIIIGTTITFFVYLIWQALVLGTVPLEGEYGLAHALMVGQGVTDYLAVSFGSSWIGMMTDFFAFFALVTSFLGIALGLFDFLSDGLKIHENRWGSIALGLLIVIPTLFFVLIMERVFLIALDTSGGIGDAILNGIFPALMVWVGRYRKGYLSDFSLPLGKPMLVFVMSYAVFVFLIEIAGKIGWMVSIG